MQEYKSSYKKEISALSENDGSFNPKTDECLFSPFDGNQQDLPQSEFKNTEGIAQIIGGINNTNESVSDSTKIPQKKKEKIFEFDKIRAQTNTLRKKKGRKKKLDNTPRSHDKYSEDNIIRKIKFGVINYARDIISQNSDGKVKLLKLKHSPIKTLKKSKNIEFLDKTLKDIFSFCDASTKYKKEKYQNYNEKRIKQIYNEENKKENKKEYVKENIKEKLKKIFELKFEDLLEIFRGKINESQDKLNKLKDELEKSNISILIKEKEGYEIFINNKINQENQDPNYIAKVEDLTKKYKEWFEKKEGRDH
jgi:hypothetical protein